MNESRGTLSGPDDGSGSVVDSIASAINRGYAEYQKFKAAQGGATTPSSAVAQFAKWGTNDPAKIAKLKAQKAGGVGAGLFGFSNQTLLIGAGVLLLVLFMKGRR
jgi:hypothetical protein